MDLKEKTNGRMDTLQDWMESNHHLENPIEVAEHIESILKFWNVLEEADRDYLQCAQYAIESQKEWNI